MNFIYKGKNVFFYSNMTIDNDSIGITKKIKAQILALEALGFNVYYSCYFENGVVIMNGHNCLIKEKYVIKSKHLKRLIRRKTLLKTSIRFIESNCIEFNIAYIRFHFFDRLFSKLLKVCKQKNIYTIVEAHSFPYKSKNVPLTKKIIYWRDGLFENKAKNYIDAVFAITGEKKQIWGKRTLVMDNCVDISKYPIKERNPSPLICKMIFVAYETPAHGIDNLIKSMRDYYNKNKRNIQFELSLVGTVLPHTLELIKQLKMEKYITLYGIKTGKDLDELFNINDIGIGILAPHRVNSTIGTGLKTKEYLARGIPFIISGNSLKYEDDPRFCLKLKYGTEHFDMENIFDFYQESVLKHDYRSIMRNLIKDFTWEKQYRQLFDILFNVS